MSTQSRPMRPQGAVVSEKGNQTAPLPAEFAIEPASGDKYVPHDVLSLPRPVQPMAIQLQSQPHSILTGNPQSSESLSRGDKMTIVNLRHIAHGGGVRAAKRPKNLIKSNKSTFISRGLVFDAFAKRMKPEDPLETLVLTNFDRSLALIDYSSDGSCMEPLAKVFFSRAWPLCHALNKTTACVHQLDAIVGMSSGDLVWMDLASQRYERVNKMGNLTHAPVTAISWMPNSESFVVAAHTDGLVCVYDVYGEDTNEPLPPQTQPHPGDTAASHVILSSSTSAANRKRNSLKAAYRLSTPGQRITALEFISATKLVIAAHNGYLKVFDFEKESTVELWPSLFGSIHALALSPDGRYLCSGGEDDLISVFDLQSSRMVARLSGHKAWIRSIAFDEFGCDETGYRLASVGEDQQLIVWDLTQASLTQPKGHPLVDIEEGLKYTSSTHHYDGTDLIVRGRVLQYATSTLFFSAKAKPHFEEYGHSALTDVGFSRHLLLASSADGRVWSWKKQRSQAVTRRSLV